MRRLRNLLKYHFNIVTAILSILIALLGELVNSQIKAIFGPNSAHLLVIVTMLTALVLLVAWLVQRRRVALVPTHKRPPRMEGLIALVGRGDPKKQAARAAIEYHLAGEPRLRVCWLIASRGLHGSHPTAIELKEMYEDRCRIEIHTIADPFDLHEVYSLVRQIYDERVPQAGLSPSQVITDFTGGTAPMSAGAVLACREYHVPAQYMSGGTAEIESMPIMVSFTPGE
jgi:hypothetical protein